MVIGKSPWRSQYEDDIPSFYALTFTIGRYDAWAIIKVSGHQYRWLAGGYDVILSSQVVSLPLQSVIEVANVCAAMDTLIDQDVMTWK